MSARLSNARWLAALGASAVLSGCAVEVPDTESAPVATEGQRCIAGERIVARHPVDARTLRFEMLGGADLLNRLPDACPGLANADTLDIVQIEIAGVTAGQVCEGDRFRVVDPQVASVVGARAFAECRLGAFVPVTRTN